MATKTYHISLPAKLAKEIDREMKNGYYTPSEYFKHLYRKARQEELLADIREAEEDIKHGRVYEADSITDALEKYRDELEG